MSAAEASRLQQQQQYDGADAGDLQVEQVDKGRKSKLSQVAGYIILTEFCERLAYYGFSGSLVLLFEKELGFSNAQADTQFALWSGVCYIMPLFGGWVADRFLGRYHSILFFSIVYLVGLFVAAASCVPGAVSPLLLFPAIYLLALGTGGIKSSVSVFGADQFDDDDPGDVEEKQSFFNWFYWSINLGALVSFTVVSYVCQYGLTFLGGAEWGFMAGYSIPCIAMSIGLVVFLAGTPRYRRFPPSGSVVSRAAGVVVEAAWTRRLVGSLTRGGYSDGIQAVHGGGTEVEPTAGAGQPHWLQRASERSGGSYPHEEVVAVSRVWRLLPFLALQVPYWAVYAQMGTAFQNQGCQMDLSVLGFSIPVSTLNMFDTLAVLLLIPIADRVVYPWMRNVGCEPTMLRKIGAGLLFAGAALLVASAVEVSRRNGVVYGDGAVLSPCRRAHDYDPQQFQEFWKTRRELEPAYRPEYCHKVPGCNKIGVDGLLSLDCIGCEAPPLASSMSVLWQIPQYLLIGSSEILSAVTSLEFFYAEAPTTVRGVSAGLNLLTTALGSWMTVPILSLVNSGAFGEPWVPDDLNDGHLENYFCFITGLVVASLVAFVAAASGYTYQGVVDGSPSNSDATAAETPEPGREGDFYGGGGLLAGGSDGRSARGLSDIGGGVGRRLGTDGGRPRGVSWDEESSKLLAGGAGIRLARRSDASPTFGQI
eukprot:g6962.t1